MNVINNIFSIKQDSDKKRILFLDFVRGLLILSVLYHHSNAPFGGYILQFHMPALFFLSGCTECILDKKTGFCQYVKNRFFRLIIPYFLFELLNLILFLCTPFIFGEPKPFVETAKSILTCINNSYMGLYGRLWFLPAMFVSSVVAYVIRNVICRGKKVLIMFFTVVMFAATYASLIFIFFRLPFTLDISLLGTSFFLIGYLSGDIIKHYLKIKNVVLDILLAIIFASLFVAVNMLSDPKCLMYTSLYYDFPFMVIGAFFATLFVFVAVKIITPVLEKIVFLKNIILWYSTNSLATFPIHLTIKVFVIPILLKFDINHWSILFIAMFIFTIPLVNVIRNYMPFMLGIFKRKSVKVNN